MRLTYAGCDYWDRTRSLMDGSVRPAPLAGFSLEEMDGELLLFHVEQEKVLYCNATAGLVWRLCDGERTLDEIVELLTEAYPEAREKLRGDVVDALGKLSDAGALRLG